VSGLPPWRLSWSPLAIDDLAKLNDATTTRIRTAVRRLAETHQGDIKKLQGRHERWRLRVGDWRILFRFARETQSVIVLRVLNRRDAYRD
jgi:mRNA interferase RelE/StbE